MHKAKTDRIEGKNKQLNNKGRHFNTIFSIMNRKARQKMYKKTEDSNNTINQLSLTDINRTLYPTTIEEAFLQSSYGTFFQINHMLGHKTSLNKFQRIEIIQNMFSNHNVMLREKLIAGIHEIENSKK